MFLHYYGVDEDDLWDWPIDKFERHRRFCELMMQRGGS